MEEGEVSSVIHAQPETVYDPAYEWPGDTGAPQPAVLTEPASSSFKPCLLRLLVQTSSVLPKSQHLAVLDEYKEVQFGRDVAPAGTSTPRVRLKEMAVSKVHATIFWDAARREWAVVDMGSKHGSFLRPGGYSGPAAGEDLGFRLSPSRVASFPRTLKHGDALTIGGTTFVVHIHADRMSCARCVSSENGDNLIPLFPVSKAQNQSVKRAREEVTPAPVEERDAKKALTMLKRTLLSRHEQTKSSPSQSSSYVDRSAKRRALYPSSPLDTPGVSSPRSNSPSIASGSISTLAPENPPRPQPLPESNIGRRLLMKQGWEPGMALGSNESASALIEPLDPSATSYRAGLGMPDVAPTPYGGDWRESGKQRRWAGMLDAK